MQSVRIGEEIFHTRRDEARLQRVGLLLPPGANVGGALQGYTHADLLRGTHHQMRQEIPFLIGGSIGRMVQVVKLADGGDAAQYHFEKCHSRGVIDIVRREARGGMIHGFAPGPKRVAAGMGAMLGAATDGSLKRMRVRIDKARQNGAPGQMTRYPQIAGRLRNTRNAAVGIANDRTAADEPAFAIDKIRQPGGLAGIGAHGQRPFKFRWREPRSSRSSGRRRERFAAPYTFRRAPD